ncbi:MAG: carbamoyltransferase HypF [Chloroflexi bacterium]|nr:carbamoyltransferase HypF [Chloroflexota bacterium]
MAQNALPSNLNAGTRAVRLHVRGVVQGVGFRPFVYTLAQRFALSGWVRNTSSGVEIHLEGSEQNIAGWQQALRQETPPLASITAVELEPAPLAGYESFTILASTSESGAYQAIPADAATCPLCLHELLDPHNRRYRYPFINCTHCGPRFTIIDDIPYDRPKTTMRGFVMCPACQHEYDDPADRRFHAQPNACPVCGPHLDLLDSSGNLLASKDEALTQAVLQLKAGKIIALKGIGGFQLACDATNAAAVQRLRTRKQRPAKPFAIMLASLDAVAACVSASPLERELLQQPSAPIVLCRRLTDTNIAETVAPNLDTLGVMLPYSPLHHLLLNDTGLPLVMTSGNLSEEPLARDNAEALQRLGCIADVFLVHNRGINTRLDDSIQFVAGGQPQMARRARGYAPNPIHLLEDGPSVLACGPELKNTFCLTHDNLAFISPHLGNMQNLEAWRSFEESLALHKHIFHTEPSVIAYDMHPEYMTSKYALTQTTCQQVAVQHHHAHLAACLADTQYQGTVIGVIFDGTGFGLDGTIWGGEFLLGDARGFVRAGHLQPLPLPGGDAAIHKPYRIAWAYWKHLLGSPIIPKPLAGIPLDECDLMNRMLEQHINTPLTTSAGRLFDAVSALLGICSVASYEAQAAVELEAIADHEQIGNTTYPFRITPFTELQHWGKVDTQLDTGFTLELAPLFAALGNDMHNQTVGQMAYRFHAAVAQMIAAVCTRLAAASGVNTIALSGGCFQNRLLLELTARILCDANLRVITHHQVPCNDGGLALGQAVIARAVCEGS